MSVSVYLQSDLLFRFMNPLIFLSKSQRRLSELRENRSRMLSIIWIKAQKYYRDICISKQNLLSELRNTVFLSISKFVLCFIFFSFLSQLFFSFSFFSSRFFSFSFHSFHFANRRVKRRFWEGGASMILIHWDRDLSKHCESTYKGGWFDYCNDDYSLPILVFIVSEPTLRGWFDYCNDDYLLLMLTKEDDLILVMIQWLLLTNIRSIVREITTEEIFFYFCNHAL